MLRNSQIIDKHFVSAMLTLRAVKDFSGFGQADPQAQMVQSSISWTHQAGISDIEWVFVYKAE
jgi:hypothetical protein